MPDALPDLPYEAWEPTKKTLHLYAQVVGKIRLASTAPQNHWWNVPLYVDVRGLTTRRLQRNGTSFDLTFDFLDHRLVVRTDRGEGGSFALHDGLSVAEFERETHALLSRFGVDVAIRGEPFGVPMKTPFHEDTEHGSYDADFVQRFWRTLEWVDGVLAEFAGWFCGKQSPVHLFWHSLDLALTRFSGRKAPPLDGVDSVTREAYSEEVISFGFWAGDDNLGYPAFYSYTAPEPPGLRDAPLRPEAAQWVDGATGGTLALLPYDAVRSAPDPRATLLSFLQSAYEGGAGAAGWERGTLDSAYCPSPGELSALSTG
jgi:hypothetical protein